MKHENSKKKVLVAMDEDHLRMVDFMAKKEHRTRADLIREALRRYEYEFRRNNNMPAFNGGITLLSRATTPDTTDDSWRAAAVQTSPPPSNPKPANYGKPPEDHDGSKRNWGSDWGAQ